MKNIENGFSHLIVRQIDDDLLILDTTLDKVHQLNPAAALIWRMASETVPAKKIVEALAAKFDLDPLTAERDVGSAILKLEVIGLL